MSHITVIINRTPHPASMTESEPADSCTAEVSYVVPHDATDAQVAQAVKKLVKQVRDLGS